MRRALLYIVVEGTMTPWLATFSAAETAREPRFMTAQSPRAATTIPMSAHPAILEVSPRPSPRTPKMMRGVNPERRSGT